MHSEELPTNLDKEGVSNNSNNDFEKNNMIKKIVKFIQKGRISILSNLRYATLQK